MVHPHVKARRRRLAALFAFNAGMMAWAIFAMLSYKPGDGASAFATLGAVWLAVGSALSLYVSYGPLPASTPVAPPLRRTPPPLA